MTTELPHEEVENVDGHITSVAGYAVGRYQDAPQADRDAFARAARSHGVEADLLGMWHCKVCRAHFGVNELDIMLGVDDPMPICSTLGCSGAGWNNVSPE